MTAPRRVCRLLLLVVLVTVFTPLTRGLAVTPPPPVHVKVELAAEQPTTPNYVTLAVTVTDSRSGKPPTESFVVFGQASNAFQEQTDPGPCIARTFQFANAPEGVFDCTVIVDHGGKWLFEGLVNRVSPEGKPVEIARGGIVLDIKAGTLLSAGQPPSKEIAAKRSDVLLLLVHLSATTGWTLAVLALTLLSVRRCRDAVSKSALHWLEVGRFRLVAGMWTATFLTVSTGVLLMSRQTAYSTPTSSSQLRAVNALPYGKAYFTALAVKIFMFAVMVIAAAILAKESGRLARAADRDGRLAGDRAEPSPWTVEGTVKPIREPKNASGARASHSAGWAAVAAFALVGGLVVVETCVVLLKYFHELVEAARNVGVA